MQCCLEQLFCGIQEDPSIIIPKDKRANEASEILLLV